MFLKQEPGVLYVGMRSVVEHNEIHNVCSEGQRYLASHEVEAMVLDIRGCKPIDSASFEELKDFFVEARKRGVRRFARIGAGTLCAMQIRAMEEAADVRAETEVNFDESTLTGLS